MNLFYNKEAVGDVAFYKLSPQQANLRMRRRMM